MNARKLLETIGDGDWHSFADLAQELRASPDEVTKTGRALSECGVVEYEENAEKVRLSSWVKNLSAEVEVKEGKVAVGLIILPPGGSIRIQDTIISNFTDIDLELCVRIDKKIRELALSKIK